MEINKIYEGDCIDVLKTLPDNSVDCCVTSPPYFGLRDYGTATWEGGIDKNCKHIRANKAGNNSSSLEGGIEHLGGDAIYKNHCIICGAKRIDNQIGLEQTPELYVAKMVEVFTEVKRVLKKEGTLWLNLGDSYNGSGKGGNPEGSEWSGFVGNKDREKSAQQIKTDIKSLKPKDLIGIPWMVAFALRSSGWYLRQDLIWHKPNPMPESVTDRCTKAHEYVFLLSKSAKYHYDAEAIMQQAVTEEGDKSGHKFGGLKNDTPYLAKSNVPGKKWVPKYGGGGNGFKGHSGNTKADGTIFITANKRSVWNVATYPYAEAHFAIFPEKLIVDMIKAGCPEGGIVIDCFIGAGTTALVARKLNRNFIGIELNPAYIKMAEKRLKKELGMFI